MVSTISLFDCRLNFNDNHSFNSFESWAFPNDSSVLSTGIPGRLQRTRKYLGGYRHDLMIALRVVNSIEREMTQIYWEDWVHDESDKCRQVIDILPHNGTTSGHRSANDTGELKRKIENYCSNCMKAEQQLLEDGANIK